MPDRAFGRLAHDPAALARVPPASPELFAAMRAPAPLDRRDLPFQPRLLHNDTLPVCSAAGLLNYALAVEVLNTGGDLAIADDVELPFYAGCAGCAAAPEAIAATDGVQLITALRRFGRTGFPIGALGPLTGDVARIDVSDLAAVAIALARSGAFYAGIDLYQRDMDTPPSVPWDDDGSDHGALVGGHCVVLWDYLALGDTNTGRLATWGDLQPFTWRWWKARAREAYELVLPMTQRADGTGINRTALRAANVDWLAM